MRSVNQPRIVISIASGATPKVTAKPFFASANVSEALAQFENWPDFLDSWATRGICSHFRVAGSIPNSSSDEYHTGFRLPFHTSGISTLRKFTESNLIRNRYSAASVSEGFYALLPLVALAIYLDGVKDWPLAFRTRIRPGITIIGGLFALILGLAYLFLDRGVVLSWRFWLEVASCMYYLAGALIVLLAVRRSLLTFARSLHERWRFSAGVRILLCEALPLAIFVLFALPYAIAFANVHRFKMPILSDPRRVWHRDFEEIEFASADGTALRGWWIPAKPLTPDPSPRVPGRGEKNARGR